MATALTASSAHALAEARELKLPNLALADQKRQLLNGILTKPLFGKKS
jgi:hypothetical protein